MDDFLAPLIPELVIYISLFLPFKDRKSIGLLNLHWRRVIDDSVYFWKMTIKQLTGTFPDPSLLESFRVSSAKKDVLFFKREVIRVINFPKFVDPYSPFERMDNSLVIRNDCEGWRTYTTKDGYDKGSHIFHLRVFSGNDDDNDEPEKMNSHGIGITSQILFDRITRKNDSTFIVSDVSVLGPSFFGDGEIYVFERSGCHGYNCNKRERMFSHGDIVSVYLDVDRNFVSFFRNCTLVAKIKKFSYNGRKKHRYLSCNEDDERFYLTVSLFHKHSGIEFIGYQSLSDELDFSYVQKFVHQYVTVQKSLNQENSN